MRALVLVAALAFAFFLRFDNLTAVPFPLHNDEMSCGLEAERFLSSAPPSLFGSSEWYGLPNFGFFLISLPLRLFGDNLFGLRMGALVASMASLLGLYFLVKELFDSTAGWWAVVLTAAYHFHLHFSRSGFHYIYAAAFGVWALFFAIRGFRTGQYRWAIFAGLATGIGMQTYPSAFVTPGLIAVASVPYLFSRFWSTFKNLCCAAVSTLVAAVPIAYNIVTHHTAGIARVGVFIFFPDNLAHVQHGAGAQDWFHILLYQVTMTLRLFWLHGKDSSAQYGFAGSFMDPVMLALFVSGVLIAVAPRALFTALGSRFPFGSQYRVGVFLVLAWMFLVLLSGAVLTIDPPFSPRIIMVSVLLPIIPAAVLSLVVSAVRNRPLLARIGVYPVVLLLAAGSIVWNLHAYFVVFQRQVPGQRIDAVTRAAAARIHPGDLFVHLFSDEPYDHQSYQFMLSRAERVHKNVGDVLQFLTAKHPRHAILAGPTSPCPLPGWSCESEVLTGRFPFVLTRVEDARN